MKIDLIVMGKTQSDHLKLLINEYEKRLNPMVSFTRIEIPDIKNAQNLSETLLKEKEAEQFMAKIHRSDYVVLLDAKGQQFDSPELAKQVQKIMNQSVKKMVVVVGGAYGFSQSMYQRSQEQWSFSKLTFTHQMVRLFFIEQLYRIFAILNHLPYHHE